MKKKKEIDLIVVGGGAAGFFAAIQVAELDPAKKILILEKTGKLLTKVKVSGGGRCNVTQYNYDRVSFAHHYPRGKKKLQQLFKQYQAKDVVEWFKEKNVLLKAEEDGRMFPVTNNSQTIIDCFLKEVMRHQIEIEVNTGVVNVRNRVEGLFELETTTNQIYYASQILIATGGHPKLESYSFLSGLGISIVSPIPSLFTFNDRDKHFTDLMGIAVLDAVIKISGTKFVQQGPLLITHWGLSGPAVIKLSAWAAEYLHSINYTFSVLVSWVGLVGEDDCRNFIDDTRSLHPKQKVLSKPLYGLPTRLWQKLCMMAEIQPDKIWSETSKKSINKLVDFLIRCPFQIKGKTTFKEEFVTCGGIDLDEVDINKMECKKIPGLFFAGEILNIDGETGGYNFQAAWTTGYVAAKAIVAKS